MGTFREAWVTARNMNSSTWKKAKKGVSRGLEIKKKLKKASPERKVASGWGKEKYSRPYVTQSDFVIRFEKNAD